MGSRGRFGLRAGGDSIPPTAFAATVASSHRAVARSGKPMRTDIFIRKFALRAAFQS
jgi:hypothetical protein